MSFFKKAMANVLGIGGAKVDTVLSTKSSTPGGIIEGNVNIYGGEIDQQIQSVYIDINTSYEKETSDDKKILMNHTIERFTINIERTILAKEHVIIPFSFNVDYNTPITKGRCKTWISTRLDIENAVDNIDGDNINILPNKHMSTILKSIEELGFKLKSVENIYNKYRMSNHKFIQEFEYIPYSGKFRGLLDELEVVFISNANGIDVILEVDRKVRGLGSLISEKLSLDETLVKVSFTYTELSNSRLVTDRIYSTIARYS